MKCVVCNEEIHPKRLEILPGIKTCVKHSTTEKHKCVTVQYGEGDHTYNDVVILKEEDAWNLEQSEKSLRKDIENENNKEFESDLSISPELDEVFIEIIAENIETLENDEDSSQDPSYLE